MRCKGGAFFSAREYVEGNSLHETARRAELPAPSEIVRIAGQVAGALDYAHGRDLVHGNLHPKHILLDRTGHVRLIGFGELGPVRPYGVVGNPHFLAPEQVDNSGRVVPQTDVYGLAEVVFLLLTGSFPFQGAEGIGQLLERKRSARAPSIRERRPELPRRVDLVLQRAMALRPEHRHPSAGQFVEDLGRALHGAHKQW